MRIKRHSGEGRARSEALALSSNSSMFWMPVEDPVFSGDQVRHDRLDNFRRSSKSRF